MEDYKKYKWFFTKSGKLVVGGKNAEQNDELINKMKKNNVNYIVMHTKNPGSPFSIILDKPEKVNKEDIEECAVFTGCFSKTWRDKKNKVVIDVFRISSLYKNKEMSVGTWGVKKKVERLEVEKELFLIKQKGILRAVPKTSVKNKKEIIVKILPGNLEKKDAILKIQIETNKKLNQEELTSALPSGGIRIKKSLRLGLWDARSSPITKVGGLSRTST